VFVRNFGTAELLKDSEGVHHWQVTAEPHVMIRLKNIIGRINKASIGTVTVRNSPEVCRDIEWFCQRYPLEIKQPDILKSGADQYRAQLEALERIQAPDYQPRTFSLALPPRHYQSVAAEAYLTRKSQLLADHVGLGKSITALAALTDKRTLPALVVCQAHLPKQWKDYVGRFMPMAACHIIKTGKLYNLPSADIYICTYHKMAKWAEILRKLCKSVIFDECQELRHETSQKYQAAVAIRDKCDFAQGLSATPIFNYGGEIFNVLQVLSPDEVGTQMEFRREWCDAYGKMLKNPEAFGAYLRERGLMLRRTRSDVGMELPPIQTIIETVEYNDKVLLDLDKCATELAHRILSAESSFHTKGEAAREFDMKLRQATGIAKAAYVAAFVKMLLDDGEKVVMTGWHRAVYDVWASLLQPDYGMYYYTGSESPNQKNNSVNDFIKSSKPCVFVMSLRSGSGLDGLQNVCSTIVHGELDWSPGVHLQCTGRLARDGQSKPVFNYYMISDGGSDPTVADVLGLKKAQSEGLLNPTGKQADLVQTDDAARIKRLAQDFLARRHKPQTKIT
jgi:superfamily II DNA or RNA helicase